MSGVHGAGRIRRKNGSILALLTVALTGLSFLATGIAAASTPPTTIGVGSIPLDLTYDTGNKLVYAVNYNSGNVSIINTTTNRVVANPNVGTIPHHIAYDPANGYVYVPNYGTSNISVLSGTSFLTNLSSSYAPFGAAYDPNASDMVVTDFSGGCAYGLVDWISSANAVTVQNLTTRNGLTDVLAYDGTNHDMFVVSQPYYHSNCTVDPSADKIVVITPTSIVGSIVHANAQITSLAYDPTNGYMYAANSAANVVYAISSSTNKVTATVGVGSSPWDLAYNPTLKEMFVTNSGSANVSAISSASLTVVASYVVGNTPEAIVYVAANSDMYDVDTASNTVTVTPNSVPLPVPTWHSLGPQTPGARYDAAMTFANISTSPEYVLDGGLSSTNAVLGDTWVNVAGAWIQVCPTGGCAGGPPPLWGASMVYGDDWVIMFGGCLTPAPCTSASSATWEFNVPSNTWTALSITGPSARYDASMAAVPGMNVGVLFGGRTAAGAPLGDTWEIAVVGTAFAWGTPTTIGTPPPASWGGGMSYDLSDPTDQMVFFGGASAPNVVNAATYAFSGFAAGSVTSGSWRLVTTATTPSARWGNSMTYFGQGIRASGTGQYVLMFGGIDTATTPNTVYGDTWYYTAGNWHHLLPTVSPSPRYDASIGYSYPSKSAFLYGGYDPVATPPTVYADGWLWY